MGSRSAGSHQKSALCYFDVQYENIARCQNTAAAQHYGFPLYDLPALAPIMAHRESWGGINWIKDVIIWTVGYGYITYSESIPKYFYMYSNDEIVVLENDMTPYSSNKDADGGFAAQTFHCVP